MSRKLDELNARLDALQAALPALIAEHPNPADFWEAFANQAYAIEDEAGEHAHAVNERIDAMLAMHGRYIASVDPQ
ncbi:hypothetical protein LDO26_01180 [Luteimonas sp. BDR2-5]|uniref:hypothetical protein n=1 Tax=Proluteimonas luteida TaxID=2878685 RepID=UPI001E2C5A5E|nr:hypothetical protein [Luteimonas sp. BDR2-5]MCD9026829.1 hypothetical protein [Luteimonas sp. BDR2-5]